MPRSPADAVVALRSLERRFRGLFAGREHDESPDDLALRPGSDGRAALDHVVATTTALTDSGQALHRVLVDDDPELDADVLAPPAVPTGTTGSVEHHVAHLAAAADALASRAERVSAEEWGRRGHVHASDAPVTAVDVVWSAVDRAVEHLRAAEQTLDAVRGRG